MHGTEAPSGWIVRWSHLVPAAGRVLDLACGAGRHMQWFAGRGHPVLGVDCNYAALDRAGAFGATLQADLEHAPWPLPGQTFDAVVVTNYLWRPLWPHVLESIAPGGVLLYETFARGQETVGRPCRPEFLLEQGELLRTTSSLRTVAFEEGFEPSPARFVQRIAAVREHDGAEAARWTLA